MSLLTQLLNHNNNAHLAPTSDSNSNSTTPTNLYSPSSSSAHSLTDLPDDITDLIISYLNTASLLFLSARPVCKSLTKLYTTKLRNFEIDLDRDLVSNSYKAKLNENYAQLISLAYLSEELYNLTLNNFGSLLNDENIQLLLEKHCYTLHTLSLSHSDLVGPIIRCSNLISADLSKCRKLSAPILACPQLTELDFSRNFLNDLDLQRALLESSERLKILKLQYCKNIRTFPLNIRNIQILDLSGTSIIDDTVNNVATFPLLRVLFLHDCKELHAPFILNDNLAVLSLRGCINLKNPQINCQNLKDLELSNTDLRDIYIANALRSCRSLESLSLEKCYELFEPSINSLSTNNDGENSENNENSVIFPHLSRLDLSQSSLNALGLSTLLSLAPNITQLSVAQLKIANDWLSLPLPSTVQHLNLRAAYITDAVLSEFLLRNQQITLLNLRNCVEITGNALSCRELRDLDLSHTALTSENLSALFSEHNCPKLTKLTADFCKNLTRITISSSNLVELSCKMNGNLVSLALCCSKLQVVELNSCFSLNKCNLVGCCSLSAIHVQDISSFVINSIMEQLNKAENSALENNILPTSKNRVNSAQSPANSMIIEQKIEQSATSSHNYQLKKPDYLTNSPKFGPRRLIPPVSAGNSTEISEIPVNRSSPRPIERKTSEKSANFSNSANVSPGRGISAYKRRGGSSLGSSPANFRDPAGTFALNRASHSPNSPAASEIAVEEQLNGTNDSTYSHNSENNGNFSLNNANVSENNDGNVPLHSIKAPRHWLSLNSNISAATAQSSSPFASPLASSGSPTLSTRRSISARDTANLLSRTGPILISNKNKFPTTIVVNRRNNNVNNAVESQTFIGEEELGLIPHLGRSHSAAASIRSKFQSNSIEMYIIQQNIAEIEYKLQSHEKAAQYYKKLALTASKQQKIKGNQEAKNENTTNLNSPPARPVEMLNCAVEYGLKRQLAVLKARLRREQREAARRQREQEEEIEKSAKNNRFQLY
jgi:hypothetical protein